MNYPFFLTVFTASLLFAAPVYCTEISANTIKALHEYKGDARIMLKPGEKFNIASHAISQVNGMTIFTGNVVITSGKTTFRADTVTAIKQADGSTLLKANAFSQEQVEIK
ncbi:LptA/OstA family protein [Citrobacter braakii]|uniref:LptA/OstA family protein n=1 Tax=Citrobacter braakii TaxID=57706 RepID=UPI003974983C